MTTTHSTAAQNAATDAVVDLIDAGTGAGKAEIKTSGDVEVSTLTGSDPFFGSSSSGIATANAITSDSATGGTAAKIVVEDSDGNEHIFGAVTAVGGGGQLELTTVTIPAAATLSISSMTYQALPA